ncbi:MAG: DNA-formamidopyrimidine glycosylase [Nitrospirae bacterium]|nr:DNA-formamidopyrimidine glycosylase [Nitrospirota bacterium]MCL5285305.1 DNA-formamidopyrimidine glycosylase [Nitrospirota bacterium]
MPELPEVETSRMDLQGFFTGAAVRDCRVLDPRIRVGHPSPPFFRRGQWVGTGIERHGKTLIMGFSQNQEEETEHSGKGEKGFFLLSRFGMSGSWRRVDARLNPPHTHLEIRFSDRTSRLVWVDPRRFGRIEFATVPFSSNLLSRVGPDALSVSASVFEEILRSTSRSLRSALMDQGLLAGIGNIYMAEILFDAGLSPFREGRDLLFREVRVLHASMHSVLRAAIAEGGSTIHSFAREDGRNGGYQKLHLVYGREGQPCPRCGLPVRKVTLEARSLYYCPSCQPPKRSTIRSSSRRDPLEN